jgi:DNA processing protein
MQFPIIEIARKTKEYPRLLSKISDPPHRLYCRGNIALLNTFCLGVVGTRKLTTYGRQATEQIVTGLANSGMTIVSGLAMGIDAVAHKSALENDLPTIAVLGSTVDDNGIGPQVNLPLAKEILKNDGLIISEYNKKSEIFPSNFAIRDRIISGLSKGVLIVEGAEKSGSLITAKSAADQNRDVFAVP